MHFLSQRIQSHGYGRTESEDELEGFLQLLNAFHPNLKFTHDKPKVSINFLVTFSINGEEFETDLYCKPTDCHQFLEFNSAHLIYNKGCVSKKMNLKSTLKVYFLGLACVFIRKDLLTIKLGKFLKANQSRFLKVAPRLGLVYHLL